MTPGVRYCVFFVLAHASLYRRTSRIIIIKKKLYMEMRLKANLESRWYLSLKHKENGTAVYLLRCYYLKASLCLGDCFIMK